MGEDEYDSSEDNELDPDEPWVYDPYDDLEDELSEENRPLTVAGLLVIVSTTLWRVSRGVTEALNELDDRVRDHEEWAVRRAERRAMDREIAESLSLLPS